MNFNKDRWKKLAGLPNQEKAETPETLSESFTNLGMASPAIMGNPFGDRTKTLVADLKEMDMDEQIKFDDSPASLEPAMEDFEDFKQDAEFEESMPPGWEDHGFNAAVIQDIGQALQTVDRSLDGLRKAEMLADRLEKAIEALKVELREGHEEEL